MKIQKFTRTCTFDSKEYNEMVPRLEQEKMASGYYEDSSCTDWTVKKYIGASSLFIIQYPHH